MSSNRQRPFGVCVVCSGNICRSPIGEKVLQDAFARAGLADQVVVTSAGTGDWHVGDPAHRQTVAVLAAAGLPTDHVARQLVDDDLPAIDLVLAADSGHLRHVRAMVDDPDSVVLLRSFDPAADDLQVPDPYGGPRSAFDEVLAMVQAAAPGVVAHVRTLLSTDERHG